MEKYTVKLEEVCAQEEAYIAKRRSQALPNLSEDNQQAGVSHNTMGLALSGGGMRSAVFNLGVIQALAKLGCLSWIDYLITVSGGGYLGTCLTALLSTRILKLARKTDVCTDPVSQESLTFLEAGVSIEIIGQPWWQIEFEGELDEVWVNVERDVVAPKSGKTAKALYVWDNPEIQSVASFLPQGSEVTFKQSQPWYKIRYKHQESPTEPLIEGWIKLDKPLTSPQYGDSDDDYRFKFDLRDRFPLDPDCFAFTDDGDTENGDSDVSHPQRNHQLYHLRLHGNFVIPRRGILKQDTLRAVGAVITGVSRTLSIFIVLSLLIAALHYVIAGMLSPDITRKIVVSALAAPVELQTDEGVSSSESIPARSSTVPLSDLFQVIFLQKVLSVAAPQASDLKIPIPYWIFLGGGAFSSVASYLYIRHFYRHKGSAHLADEPGLSIEETEIKLVLRDCAALAIIVLISLLFVLKFDVISTQLEQSGPNVSSLYWLWMPATFTLGSWLTVTFVYPYFFEAKIWDATFRSTIASWQGLNTYGLLISLAAAVLALPYYFTFSRVNSDDRNITILIFSALISGIWSYILAGGFGKSNKGEGLSRLLTLPAGFKKGLLSLLAVVLALSIILLFGTLFERMPDTNVLKAGVIFFLLTTGAIVLGSAFLIVFLLPYDGPRLLRGAKTFFFRALLTALALYLITGITLFILGWFNLPNKSDYDDGIANLIGIFFAIVLYLGLFGSAWFLTRIIGGFVRRKVQPWRSRSRTIFGAVAGFLGTVGWIYLSWRQGFSLGAPWDNKQWVSVLMVGILAALMTALLSQYIDLNRISFHYFYRDRLTETFLKTNIVANRQGLVIPVRDQSEMYIQDINPDGCVAPYHLVVTALNLPGSKNLTYKDSKSEPFIFSRYFCGSDHTEYMPTHLYRGGLTRLSRAVAISGAAIGSILGQYTFFAQAFVMTIFNVRLGYWMDNPRTYQPPRMCDRSRLKDVSQLDSNTSLTNETNTFWAKYLWDELSATTRGHKLLVNLSDGGHTDNLGLYPLLQRRCKTVIVSDAGADPKYVFGDMARLIRRIYIEENIKIEINLDQLRPDPQTGLSHHHCAVGKIIYPKKGTAPEQEGWLIYLKPALTGDEEGSIVAYWWTHREDHFPHQTTADQFYDDDQFEAYRRLGELTVYHTLETLKTFYERERENILTDYENLDEFHEKIKRLGEPSLTQIIGEYQNFKKESTLEIGQGDYAEAPFRDVDWQAQKEIVGSDVMTALTDTLQAARQKALKELTKGERMSEILRCLLEARALPQDLCDKLLADCNNGASALPTQQYDLIHRCLTQDIIPDFQKMTSAKLSSVSVAKKSD